jgi:hypothetical protein
MEPGMDANEREWGLGYTQMAQIDAIGGWELGIKL